MVTVRFFRLMEQEGGGQSSRSTSSSGAIKVWDKCATLRGKLVQAGTI